jgi:hypothetical protein
MILGKGEEVADKEDSESIGGGEKKTRRRRRRWEYR